MVFDSWGDQMLSGANTFKKESLFATKWTQLETIILTEISQSPKTDHVFPDQW